MDTNTNLQKKIGIFIGVIVTLGVLFVTIFVGKQPSSTSITATPITNQTSLNTNTSPTTIPASPKSTENTTTTSTSTSTPATSSTTTTSTTTPGYTLAQVATHSSASSCWSIVLNNVYDLTSWINQHPGGAKAILSMCGKDATTAFENQHKGQARPQNELKSLLIGVYNK